MPLRRGRHRGRVLESPLLQVPKVLARLILPSRVPLNSLLSPRDFRPRVECVETLRVFAAQELVRPGADLMVWDRDCGEDVLQFRWFGLFVLARWATSHALGPLPLLLGL